MAVFTGKNNCDTTCHIMKMSVNGASMIFSFISWVIYVLVGCRNPFIRYCQPLLAKTTATCSLPHPENEPQWRINIVSSCISGNQGIARILVFITELLTALIGKKTMYQRLNTDSKLIYIASCKAYKNLLLVVDNAILIRYY